ncbi:MAG: ATP synthase F1 subunit gamma [Firmicutes bacterium]|nr:ATP synthase F1 subunit gamma [Bacillota bacterium]
MATTREIQLRIKSVTGTQQITKAMKLVSTAKLQKIRGVQEANKPYFKSVYETMCSIIAASEDCVRNSALLNDDIKADGKAAYLLITGDRGLAGGYNANICRLLERSIEDKEKALIVTVGKRGREYFTRRGYQMGEHFEIRSSLPNYNEVSRIVDSFTALKTEGTVDTLYVVYTAFINTISQKPTILKLLPISTEEIPEPEDKSKMSMMNYEPDEDEVLKYIVPKYISGVVFGSLAESFASEEGARMTAMDSATDNAEEIVQHLTLQYNRARQGHITQELTEIVNGAAALEQ